MTRTPTTSVTAIAFAARAFAWQASLSARLSDSRFHDPSSAMPPLLQLPQLAQLT
jgi:hypothetical protein